MKLKLFKRVLLLLAALSLASALPSCKKKNPDNSNPDKIVVVGMKESQAVFWISGENGFKYLTEEPSSALSVAVKGKDIYIAGSIENKAVLWKNGEVQTLSDRDGSVANSVFIAGDNIYVAGKKDDKAVLWGNKSAIVLSPSTNSGAYCVVAEGEDYYIAGRHDGKAAFFKKDAQIKLCDELSKANSIFVKNGVYYFAGSVAGKVMLWKKEGDAITPTVVYEKTGVMPEGNAVAVLGNDIYVGGMKGGGETGMWKNNTEMAIEGVEKNGEIKSLAIYGNNLYIAGHSGSKGFVGKNNKKIHELDFYPYGIAFVKK